jgi:hypothetical protein
VGLDVVGFDVVGLDVGGVVLGLAVVGLKVLEPKSTWAWMSRLGACIYSCVQRGRR